MDEKIKTIIKWLENEVKGKKWDSYITTYGYHNIAIYGAGDLGKYLIWELKNSKIEIECVIDRRASELRMFESYKVYTIEDFLTQDNKVDAIVVTAVSAYDDVFNKIVEEGIDLPVLNLRDMVYEL